MSNWQSKSLSFAKSRPRNNWDWFSSWLSKWNFDINWYKFEKRWAIVFQIKFTRMQSISIPSIQFCPAISLLGFPLFCMSSSIVLSRYFYILVTVCNSMTIRSVLKLPKIAWPSPFKMLIRLYPQVFRCFHFAIFQAWAIQQLNFNQDTLVCVSGKWEFQNALI